jgi:hypothetical protein
MKGYAPDWQVRCCTCGLTFDAADLGMVFAGKVVIGKQYKLLWCQQCRWIRWLAVENRPTDMPPAGARCDLETHRKLRLPDASVPLGLLTLGWFFASAPVAIIAVLVGRFHLLPIMLFWIMVLLLEIAAGWLAFSFVSN